MRGIEVEDIGNETRVSRTRDKEWAEKGSELELEDWRKWIGKMAGEAWLGDAGWQMEGLKLSWQGKCKGLGVHIQRTLTCVQMADEYKNLVGEVRGEEVIRVVFGEYGHVFIDVLPEGEKEERLEFSFRKGQIEAAAQEE